MPDHLDSLQGVIDSVIAPNALAVDQEGTFPAAQVKALGEAGLLGLISATDVGGQGLGIRQASEVVERIASVCGSTAMVMMMHYSATPIVEALGATDVRQGVARGEALLTLAFSEAGSRSHFWAPVSEEESRVWNHKICREEGIPIGISSGAIAGAAIKVAQRPENKSKLIVAVIPSSSERYLSTWMYDDINVESDPIAVPAGRPA